MNNFLSDFRVMSINAFFFCILVPMLFCRDGNCKNDIVQEAHGLLYC